MPQEGVLVQMDGSYHNWLEGRGLWLTLLLAVDDATGTIPWSEAARGYEVFERRLDRKSTRLNSSHIPLSRMPSSD